MKKICCIILFLPLVIAQGRDSLPTQSYGSLHGHVTDLMGLPVEKAQITVAKEDGSKEQTVAGKNGEFTFLRLAGGRYIINITLQGFTVVTKKIELAAGENRLLDIALRPARFSAMPEVIIEGRVKSGNGEPLQEVTVTAINAFDGEVRFQGITGVDGRYTIKGLEFGQYIIYASKPALKIQATTVSFAAQLSNQKRQIDFSLFPL